MPTNKWAPYTPPTAAELAMARAVLLRLFTGRNQVLLSELQHELQQVNARYPTAVEVLNDLRIVQVNDGSSTICRMEGPRR